MLFLAEHLLPDIRHRVRFRKIKHRAHYICHAAVGLILREHLEHGAAAHIANHILAPAVIDRNARKRRQCAVGIKFGQRGRFLHRSDHHEGCHNVAGADIDNLEKILNHTAFGRVEHTFVLPHIHHRGNLLAAYRQRLYLGREAAGEQLRKPHKRVGYHDKEADHFCRRYGERAPVRRSHGLGYYLGKHQYEQGEYGRYYAEIGFTENLYRFRAYPCGANGVGHGVKRQYRGHGAVHIRLVLHKQGSSLDSLALFH